MRMEGNMTRKEHALSLFSHNSNCSQAVATPFAACMGFDKDAAHRLATGFGAGFAHEQQVCGAVTGGVFVISSLFGNPEGREFEKKAGTYDRTKEFLSYMKERHSDIRCDRILGRTLKTSDEWAQAREDGLFESICAKAVISSVDYLEKLIRDEKENTRRCIGGFVGGGVGSHDLREPR